MIKAAVLEAMAKAGCSTEQIIAVVRADEEANAERYAARREKDRIRQQNHRARHAKSRVTDCDTRDLLSPVGSSPEPLSPNPQSSIAPSPPKGGSVPTDVTAKSEFDEVFWPRYPNKVGKPDALKAWLRARHRASLAAIVDGLASYVQKRDDRPWCNPSTWLNQDRWNDRPAQVEKREEQSVSSFLFERARRMQEAEGNVFIETSYEH